MHGMMFDEDKKDEHEEEGADMSADSVDEMLDDEDEDEDEDFNAGGDGESEDRWE